MDADVTYRIDADGGVLAGRVKVEPGAYRRAMPPCILQARRLVHRHRSEAPEKPAFFDATRLDLGWRRERRG